MIERWTKEQQQEELRKIESAMWKLFKEADGFHSVDHGEPPKQVTQAKLRFKEATMWLRDWIERP